MYKKNKIYDSEIFENEKPNGTSIKMLFFKFILIYFNSSSVHGLSHLANRKIHVFELLVWLIIIILTMGSALVLSLGTWQRYQNNPTVISLERDRLAWNTSFPSATICPAYKYDRKKLNDYLSKWQIDDENKKKLLKQFIIRLSEANFKNLDKIPIFDEIKSDEYLNIILSIKFDFQPNILDLVADDLQPSLDKVITEMGICYTFNSKIAFYNHPKYWKDNRVDLYEDKKIFSVHPLDGEVYVNIVHLETGFDLYFHSPYDIADIASKSLSSPDGFLLKVLLTVLSLDTNEDVKKLTVAQRKCRFNFENYLSYSPSIYSYTLCRVECRINLCKRLCGCVPHFYRALPTDQICDVRGLHCLSNYSELLITLKHSDGKREVCKCLPNCNEVISLVESYQSQRWFLGSNLQWGIKEYPRMRLKRDLLFGFIDVLVYVGGMAGLFLGCSVLSFIEVIYFFTVRLFWYFKQNRHTKIKNAFKTTTLQYE